MSIQLDHVNPCWVLGVNFKSWLSSVQWSVLVMTVESVISARLTIQYYWYSHTNLKLCPPLRKMCFIKVKVLPQNFNFLHDSSEKPRLLLEMILRWFQVQNWFSTISELKLSGLHPNKRVSAASFEIKTEAETANLYNKSSVLKYLSYKNHHKTWKLSLMKWD